MSFVNRVRGSVKRFTDSHDDEFNDEAHNVETFGVNANAKSPRTSHELDRDELVGAGARAILEPQTNGHQNGSIFAAKFIGVNAEFGNMFGFDKKDYSLNTLRLLQGPRTDTRHLQEIWSDVRKGADRTTSCHLYNKAGEMLAVRLEVLLRTSELHQNLSVLVLRIFPIPHPTPPRNTSPLHGESHSPANSPRVGLFVRRNRPSLPAATKPPFTSDDWLAAKQRMHSASARGEADRLKKLMDGMIPKAKLVAAEAEIARLKAELASLAPAAAELDAVRSRMHTHTFVPKVELERLESENSRLQLMAQSMVPTKDLKAAQDSLHAAHGEIQRLTDLLAVKGHALSAAGTSHPSGAAAASPAAHLPSPADAPAAAGGPPPGPVRQNSEVSRAIAGRASNALREVFPKTIADAIMEGRTLQPINKECVSVFFSDIVGFTTLSCTLPAAKVSDLLNRLFAKFDALAEQHGVQKMDVIGDAYLAATNVMEDQTLDHAARIARFAIHAMAAAQETRLDEEGGDPECVQIRVGIHCGAVSASVLGSQGFKYTLLGDTVNTASRMESTSLPCEIQCSESSARLIAQQAPDIALRAREGGVDVKGKGRMNTFWLCRGAAAGGSGGAGVAAAVCGKALGALLPGRDVVRPPAGLGGVGGVGGVGVGGGKLTLRKVKRDVEHERPKAVPPVH